MTADKTAEPRRVIVIDDDDVILLSCQRILQKAGYEVETFSRGAAGIERLKEIHPPILLVDLKMPELDGFQVIERVRAIDTDVVIVVITGYATISTAVDAMKAGAYDFLPKPFTPDELRLIASRCYERWRLRRESAQLRREKEEAERKFVTFVSHQLKTPLVAVKQYLDVLLYTAKDQLPDTALTWITRSQVRLGEMLEIIGDWLTLAKIERGALCDGGATTSVREVVDQVVQFSRPQADGAKVALEVNVPPDLPPVRGDAVAVATVLSNLVGNAVKYNHPGGKVLVEARGDGGHIEITVSDTGIGIPAACLPSLFQEFYRVNTAEVRDRPGTGLGLAICRRITTELGGSIDVVSSEGHGTTFTVRLPTSGAVPGPPRTGG